MIVFAAGMRRAGSTAIFNIVRELVEESGKGYALRLPDHRHDIVRGYFDDPRMIVVKAHALKDYFEEFVGRAKVLMSVRDLREIVCSLIRLNQGTFDTIMQYDLLDGYIKEQQTWECATDVYFKKYEDWVDDLFEETKSIAEYLNIELDDETILEIAANWSLDSSAEHANHTNGTNHITFFNPVHVTSRRKETMYDYLSQEQIQQINERYGWWLDKYGYAR